MLELEEKRISGMAWDGSVLWLALPEERLVAAYDPSRRTAEPVFVYPHEVWDLCPQDDGLWLLAGGGKLGRQLSLWSFDKREEVRRFDCPDGAGAGIALFDGKLWLTHRQNRKLFCLDPATGKLNWMIRMEKESFSPTAYRGELWLAEGDPGPLGPWSGQRGRHFFSRYDPVRERVVERREVPFAPSCLAFDGERFWYAEEDRRGLSSTEKNFR